MTSLTRSLVLAAAVTAMIPGAVLAQQQGGDAPPPKVTVVTLQPEDVTLTSSLPGRVVASAEAEVRPQVSGLVTERLFDEGSRVEKGDPLYRIDPRTYDAALAQAQASLAQARAQSDAAEREATRVGQLRDRRVASESSQDTAVANRDAALASVASAEAMVQVAQIDLDRTTIVSPIAGEIGLALVSAGALVTASQATPLVVIRSIDPVRVDVTQSAAEIVRWQRQGASLEAGTDRTVRLELADGSTYEETGSLTGAEPNVDEMTGVITLRMEFPNPEGLLLPGMYVLADIPQLQMKNAILAPQEGVTRDRRGRPTALVVNADDVVEERMLDIVQDRGNTWIIRDGLGAGDRIVVEGLQKITTGMTVTPEERSKSENSSETADQPEADGQTEEPAAGAKVDAPATDDAATQDPAEADDTTSQTAPPAG